MTTTSRFGEAVPVQTLADGHEIPTLALGVWQSIALVDFDRCPTCGQDVPRFAK